MWTPLRAPCHTPQVTTRLEKFRGYMARLNPAANPQDAIREGLYVPKPGRSMADEVAARLELDPTSSHLIIGGIGSGKTTQLMVARDRLNQLPDMRAEYIDVSKTHDISRMNPGTLILVAGLAVGRRLERTDDKVALAAKEQFRRWAYGHQERVPVYDEPLQDYDEPPDDDGDGPDYHYELFESEPLLRALAPLGQAPYEGCAKPHELDWTGPVASQKRRGRRDRGRRGRCTSRV